MGLSIYDVDAAAENLQKNEMDRRGNEEDVAEQQKEDEDEAASTAEADELRRLS